MTAVAAILVVLLAVADPDAASEPAPGAEAAAIALAADLADHPRSEAADLYKFLHQAIFGPGHAIPDLTAVESYLRREIADLGPAAEGEAWCVPLGGEPALVRVNLRPFLAHGFDSDRLLLAFVGTAAEVEGDPGEFGVAVDLVTRWLEHEGRRQLARELQQLAREAAGEGFPAIHHSAAYREAYDPAYRVVAATAAAEHGWCGRAFAW